MSVPSSYLKARHDLLALAAGGFSAVLEVGCAAGATGAHLKATRPGVHVTGIELDPELARVANERLDHVHVGDAEVALAELAAGGDRFDLVLLGDVLEHLKDPWGALRAVRKICPDGEVLVSLPNVAHYTTVLTLILFEYWPYRDRGIHDRTHLRFFGRRNLVPLFASAGFQLEKLSARYRLLESPSRLDHLERIVRRLPGIRRPFAYQFLCRLR